MNEEEQRKIMLANISDIFTKSRFDYYDGLEVGIDLHKLYRNASPELQTELEYFWSVQYDAYANIFGHKPIPEEPVCDCGKFIKDCRDAYVHMTSGV
tara:strand:- start:43 stop:333 length:291 start_codon:yes stop_codon:yes gene_type:complete